jgi:DNA-binding CsgD family transcriptional regulator
VPRWSTEDLKVVIEVMRIAGEPASPEQRAEALLEPLRRVVPFRGAWISLLDPERREQPPLVSLGYPDGLNHYMSGPAGVAEVELLGLQRDRAVTRLSDLDIPLNELRSWAEYLAPAGFRDGLAAALITPDGRHIGMLGLNTDAAAHPTEAGRDLIGALVGSIAHAVDPMRAVTAAARIIRDAQAAVVVTRAGNPLRVPDLPGHPLLEAGSTLLTVAARQLAAHGDYATFLCPYPADPNPGRVRVTVLDCAKHPPRYLSRVVVVSAYGRANGLDRRELEILGMLVEGWPRPRIAAALAVDQRDLAESLKAIQHKLAAHTQALATLRALRQGVYIPPALARVQE